MEPTGYALKGQNIPFNYKPIVRLKTWTTVQYYFRNILVLHSRENIYLNLSAIHYGKWGSLIVPMTYISSRSLALILFILKETETNFISFKQNMFLNTLLKSLNFSINCTQAIVKKLITQNIWNKVFQIYNAIWLYQISVSFIHKDYCHDFLYTVLCYIYRDIVRRNWRSKFVSWVRALVSSNISLIMIFVVPPLWRTSFSSQPPY